MRIDVSPFTRRRPNSERLRRWASSLRSYKWPEPCHFRASTSAASYERKPILRTQFKYDDIKSSITVNFSTDQKLSNDGTMSSVLFNINISPLGGCPADSPSQQVWWFRDGRTDWQTGGRTGLMGLLTDTKNRVLRVRRECRERFPHNRLQRKRLVNDPGMHHGTCVTHVPWCISGSLTRGFGKTFPAFPAHAQPAILLIWQEAHWR